MNEPQITHSFTSKEEENKFYLECGKASRTKEVLDIVEEMDTRVTGATEDNYTRRALYELLSAIKTRIQSLDSEVVGDEK